MENNINYMEILEKDIINTSKNYANMYDRLHRRNIMTKFLIVYYSVISILYAILPKYFILEEAIKNTLDFFSVIISIILLVSSLAVSMANYSIRETKAMKALDTLKRLKKEIQPENCLKKEIQVEDCLKKDNYSNYIKKYHKTVDSMELRSNYDYYLTRKNLGKEILWWENITFPALHLFELLLYVFLIVFPIIILFIQLF